jgi:transmembrane sensor
MSLAAALAVGIGLWAFSDIWLPAPNSGTFSTDRGDQRTVSLGDGTRMTLGGASTVRVEFQDQRRDVSMERGEVFFKVARDRARPFTVKSRDLLVTAVGTAFTVRADDLRSVVAVTEGIVDVVPVRETPGGSATSLRARAGEQVIYDASREVSAIQPSDDAIAIGWQDGALTSIDEPLRDVVTRVNRYAKRQVLVAGDIAELRFTGTVLEEQIPEWAAGLERVFPVRVIEQADGSLRLESR